MDPKLLRALKGKFKKIRPEDMPPIELEELNSSGEEEAADPKEAVPPADIHPLLKRVFLASMATVTEHPAIDEELRSRNITHVLYLGPVGQVDVPRTVQLSISSEVCAVVLATARLNTRVQLAAVPPHACVCSLLA